jgi:hypothetical protein
MTVQKTDNYRIPVRKKSNIELPNYDSGFKQSDDRSIGMANKVEFYLQFQSI